MFGGFEFYHLLDQTLMNNRCIFRSRSFIILGINFGWLWVRFGHRFWVDLGSFWEAFGELKRSKIGTKILWGDLGASRAVLGPSWGHLGVVLGRLGEVLGWSWGGLGASCGPKGGREVQKGI